MDTMIKATCSCIFLTDFFFHSCTSEKYGFVAKVISETSFFLFHHLLHHSLNPQKLMMFACLPQSTTPIVNTISILVSIVFFHIILSLFSSTLDFTTRFPSLTRSEERRVGKEGTSRFWTY